MPRTKAGRGAIRDIWAEARREHEDLRTADVADPDPNLARNGIKPGQWLGAPHDRMPPGCPVGVIGRDQDGMVWCRNATGDLVAIAKWDMQTIALLFAPQINYAYWAWPAFGKVKTSEEGTSKIIETLEVRRIERDKLFTCLGNAAAKKPLFDPDKQHRGRGGWTDYANRFIWHSGKHLWTSVNGKLTRVRPGEHDGHLYTRQPLTIEPWDGPVSAAESPARRILAELRSWNWERPFLDPILVMGWIVTAIMGGALRARPIVFTTGGAGVGKSTLHELLGHVLEGFVIKTVDTTAAHVYQRMRHDALPLMIDELESKPGSFKATNVIELARASYTGGDIGRGGSDHHAVSFTMRSSFFFSAINRPPMSDADKTRMAVLNLTRLDQIAGTARKIPVRSETDGRMILRQVMDGWHGFATTGLDGWWNLLSALGLDSRAIDTYGTLLAAAELVCGHEALEECGLPIAEEEQLKMVIVEATALDRADIVENWHRCLNHLLSSPIEAWKDGIKPTVGGVLTTLGSLLDYDLHWARERLELVNLGVQPKGYVGDPVQGPYLCVPADGPQLQKLYQHTEFHLGVWFTALKQAPPSIVKRDREKTTVKINGYAKRCLLIDMAAFARHAEAAA